MSRTCHMYMHMYMCMDMYMHMYMCMWHVHVHVCAVAGGCAEGRSWKGWMPCDGRHLRRVGGGHVVVA